MQLKNKAAVIYGAGGAVGGTVARAFAREGAAVFVTGRRRAALDTLAKDIAGRGGTIETAEVDALDEAAIEHHVGTVARKAGHIDICFNAIGIPQQGLQGIPLARLAAEDFVLPLATYAKSHFLTARAAARHMVEQRSGVILIHTPEPARLGLPLTGGMGPAWAAMEALARTLSAELGPHGVRALCLRTTGIPETKTIDVVFDLHANAMGITREQFLSAVENMTHMKRSTTLAELADAAVFAASDRASSMTGTVLNLTGGIIVD